MVGPGAGGASAETAGKEGSGRVGIFRATGITHCYTLEACYAACKLANAIAPSIDRSGVASPPRPSRSATRLLTGHYRHVGKVSAPVRVGSRMMRSTSRCIVSHPSPAPPTCPCCFPQLLPGGAQALAITVLDFHGLNALTRVPNTDFGSVHAVRQSVTADLRAKVRDQRGPEALSPPCSPPIHSLSLFVIATPPPRRPIVGRRPRLPSPARHAKRR